MKESVRMIVVLTLVGLLSGGVLVYANNLTAPKIAQVREQNLKAAIYQVLPDVDSFKQSGENVYECFDKDGNLTGYALQAAGTGYQGTIKMIVGVDASRQKMTGILVLEQVETPGMGAKIAAPEFMDQFKGLTTSRNIEYVKNQKPETDYQIQAITGATVSSRSVVNIINNEVQGWLKTK
ncbi:MAG: RnfABCDGE type electron transport complex subunit G [Candidatus Margulisbacteria bacterium]|nr:RnfABCDGE type electron transport complex subunit G [Candidatus Margulisiibacteriota bacterium]